MKVIIEYNGQEIEVEEEIRICLEDLDRQAESIARKNRRHELLWDSALVEGVDGAKDKTGAEARMEDMVMDLMEHEDIRAAVAELDELDRKIIVDRFFNQMKYRELAEKYGMASSSIETRIKRVLKGIKTKL